MKNMQNTFRNNMFLSVPLAVGFTTLGLGYIPPHSEMLINIGSAFIIVSGIESTRQMISDAMKVRRDRKR